MKKLFFTLTLFVLVAAAASAQTPVSWSFSTKKINDKTYELHMTATIQNGWHLYAQQQPADAIAEPTSFSFNKNPLLSLQGKVQEKGNLEKYKDKVLGVTAHQYSNKVDFVQVVKLKAKARTAVAGKLVFQTCNGDKCLRPETVPFTFSLN
ncbi:protein-disulfide reductase DsbD domain-containing protein [Flaviaesturariibacter terrae]